MSTTIKNSHHHVWVMRVTLFSWMLCKNKESRRHLLWTCISCHDARNLVITSVNAVIMQKSWCQRKWEKNSTLQSQLTTMKIERTTKICVKFSFWFYQQSLFDIINLTIMMFSNGILLLLPTKFKGRVTDTTRHFISLSNSISWVHHFSVQNILFKSIQSR